jgi:hypothetical protein
MQTFLQKNHRIVFYSVLLLLALAQASSTELIADEAYYWVYSKFLSWGYFDHPPMIALLIKTGYSLFHNESGVRLICALLSVLTLVITESLIDKKNPVLFYTIVLGIGVLQIAGFLAVPDIPLLFFTAVFFYCYRNFVQKNNWQSTLLLSFSIALLFYTKYHGLLIVVFAFMSNLKLLRRRQTWLVAVFVLLFYAPHLLWQWQHEWVSFRYHLFESNVSVYKFSNTTDYILGQLLLTGPLVGFILLPAAFLYKPKSETEKAMKYNLAGLLVFFLLSSFRGKVEANWTMPILVSLIVLSHQFLINKVSWIKPLLILSIISLALVTAGRIYLIADIGPDNGVKNKFHYNKISAMTLAEKTGDLPVVFYNSYQRASFFWFYSGKQSHSHNAYWERRNNYNYWQTETSLLGKTVFIAGVNNISDFTDSIKTKRGTAGFTKDTLYSGLGQIKIIPEKKTIVADETGRIHIKIFVTAPTEHLYFLQTHPEIKTQLVAGIFNGKELVKEINTGITAQQIVSQPGPFDISLNLKEVKPGLNYVIRLGIQSKNYPPTHNSEKIQLTGL